MATLDPFKTIAFKEHKSQAKWFDSSDIRWATSYQTGKTILLLDGCNDKIEKFLEAIENNSAEFEWGWRDCHIIDGDDIAYSSDGYTEPDYFFHAATCEYVGRKMFEEETTTFDDVVDNFLNTPSRAILSWVEVPDKWKKLSCDFANGMYDRQDEPTDIYNKLKEKHDVLFQIDTLSPFEIGFCVWTKEKDGH